MQNIKAVENLRLSQFALTNFAILFECASGQFWLVGNKYKGEALAQDEIPVVTCAEMQHVLEKTNRDKPLETLKAILSLKRVFGATVVPEPKRT